MGAVDACVSFRREFWVTGARFYLEGIAALGADPVGKPLTLVPEPEDPHDANAVAVVVPTARGDCKVGYIPRTLAREMRDVLSELERIADAVDARCEVASCGESGPYFDLNGRLIVGVPESPEQALAPDSLARRVASAFYPEDGWQKAPNQRCGKCRQRLDATHLDAVRVQGLDGGLVFRARAVLGGDGALLVELA